MKEVEFESLPYSVQVEIACILFERIPALAHYWSWEYVLQTLADLPDPVMLQRGLINLSEIKGFESGATSPVAVKKFTAMAQQGSEPPPILVEGRELLDGWHRCAALAACGRLQVDAVDIKSLLDVDSCCYAAGSPVACSPPEIPFKRC